MSKTNESLMQRRVAAVPRGVGQIHPIFVDSAKNSTVIDVEGRELIDFAGGIAVLNTGHLHPKVVAAVQEQLTKVSHTCFQVLAYEPYVELCEKINKLVPGDFDKKTLLVTTGSDAGSPRPFDRKVHGVSVDDAIASVERIFKNDAEPRDIAAIILEPVQGEGGFLPAPKELMKRLRALCDQHGILLIADEVQTGAGRTGTFFAMEQMGVAPDLTTFAKSIAGGFPLAGVCGKAEYMDAIAPGGLGGTYAGSPIACAAALAVIEVFEEEKLLDRSKAVGERLTTGLREIQKKHPIIGDVRGLGSMIAVEVFQKGTHTPDAAAVGQVVAKAREKGLILLSCGTYGNVLRILVPLTAEDALLDKGLAIIEECFAELA